VERNAWMMFRSLADSHGVAFVNYESLRTALTRFHRSIEAADPFLRFFRIIQ
jgi:hypothetical protein